MAQVPDQEFRDLVFDFLRGAEWFAQNVAAWASLLSARDRDEMLQFMQKTFDQEKPTFNETRERLLEAAASPDQRPAGLRAISMRAHQTRILEHFLQDFLAVQAGHPLPPDRPRPTFELFPDADEK